MKLLPLLWKCLRTAAFGIGGLVLVVYLLAAAGSEVREYRLHASLRKADRILFRTGGMCHQDRDPEKGRIILDTSDPAVISRVISELQVAHSPGNFLNLACMCCGDHTFEFHSDGKLFLGLSVHHRVKLRPGDGGLEYVLSADACDFLATLVRTGTAPER